MTLETILGFSFLSKKESFPSNLSSTNQRFNASIKSFVQKIEQLFKFAVFSTYWIIDFYFEAEFAESVIR